jgi:hypothetical protein
MIARAMADGFAAGRATYESMGFRLVKTLAIGTAR